MAFRLFSKVGVATFKLQFNKKYPVLVTAIYCLFLLGLFPKKAKDQYLTLLKRNIKTYLLNAGVSSGWYQAEAMVWSWMALSDSMLRNRIKKNLTDTFLPTLFTGQRADMFDSGGRGSLRALPLLYYRRLFGDSPGLRAAVLKYTWAAGSETSSSSVASLKEEYPVPHHGASIAAIKFSEFSSIWAMELLQSGSTLIKYSSFF